MKKKTIIAILAGLLLVSLLVSATGCGQPHLKVATTTSLYDTGLWGYLEPLFEEEYGVELDVLYAGTGIALEYGRRGDVDVITIHDKSREGQFVAEGYGVERVPFAYNYFLIVGPESDPAGIKGMSPEDAFQAIYETAGSRFISRGDDSGTHGKEKAIWANAGYDYEAVRTAGQWYVEGGKGMGPTLLMAGEMGGYTLTDIGTFLSYKSELALVPLVEEGAILLNVYSAIAVNPESNPRTNIEMANNMVDFLTSSRIQELIGNYGVEDYGMQLFTPCAGAEPES
ncbi:MAG: substrate-binding domain-containing protein [Deltaproteobacteria bacterium]|nr:substrate-binding domain-containing protein [Deltaproteobacteria bacterium]